jgi:hypothetical protein
MWELPRKTTHDRQEAGPPRPPCFLGMKRSRLLPVVLNKMLKKAVQQGRSERRGESYASVR